jgi:hypothetical protein
VEAGCAEQAEDQHQYGGTGHRRSLNHLLTPSFFIKD